jgi:hypothetical protein
VNTIMWEHSPDRRTWCAARGHVVLTVTRLSSGMFRGDVEGPGVAEQSPEYRTRLAAQDWAERAGGAL